MVSFCVVEHKDGFRIVALTCQSQKASLIYFFLDPSSEAPMPDLLPSYASLTLMYAFSSSVSHETESGPL